MTATDAVQAPVLERYDRWISFWRLPRYAPRVTEIWEVRAAEGSAALGEVRWFPRWRRYAFFPHGGAVFEADCLRDLAAFCEAQTQERKEARRHV